ncbi:uncharacterized protein [Primulina eburnea]|uniref:uncharacterized protein n=1 Tax=Primulina eburnea TaxID=1245227 RepID=UPI003C6C4B9F
MPKAYDNWERLVASVLKWRQIWKLCHQQSRSPSCCSDESDSGSDINLSPVNDDAAFIFSSGLMLHPAFDMFHDSCKRHLETTRKKNARMKQIDIEDGVRGTDREFLVQLMMLSLLHHPDILLFIFPV